MTWYADLGPIDYFRRDSFPYLRAVGWLGYGHPFSLGEPSQDFFEQLCVLLLDPWDPHHFRGYHECELCPGEWDIPPGPDPGAGIDPFERSMRIHGLRKVRPPKPERIRVRDQEVNMGLLNLWVPGDGCVYVAPSLIAHYIQAHRYSPPQEFVEAVLRCPEAQSQEHRDALRTLPVQEFVRWELGCRETRSPEYISALRASGAKELAEKTPWWIDLPRRST